ncbi:hypothetical protein [Nocardia barduliensis]|uniref:hypothetical protein n=1 Tax=Nocardia barduliensis TaxID=2736643 RepID=UPI001571E6AA|nr:hypothetical protein [Nocardia barduliensis]
MTEGPQHWLYTSSREHQVVVLKKTPVVSYPFGTQPESSSSDSDARHASAATGGVSVEDPRIMHTRPSLSGVVDAAADERNDTQETSAAASSWPSTPLDPGHTEDTHPAPSAAAATTNNPEFAVEPMPQAQALAQVRKHILTRDSGTDNASLGRLAAERFNVGWIVYTPAGGGRRATAIYYVADDGELEETSCAADPSTYRISVEQRFWQRRALFG